MRAGHCSECGDKGDLTGSELVWTTYKVMFDKHGKELSREPSGTALRYRCANGHEWIEV